ncbi:glutamine--fructose-6-phosphate transaminase (isomerizing) [Hydrogenibacillus schlegelii]|uniref:Glutamine--fructose-6-phosphate aminotransferase [isomerizing] n=1 Tax=Hydrogenibacillus schlegelii TaxID=1484 RepID=A0A132N5S5_HYDSH|nr:glutamine--fructose-6-phosphate transaminase (isomerizing) [Hydrogenibacillus schlegelii]KWX04902.1 glutamine--fructose-6-phosphate aminotransferase [Hydrogenibacillus schlegelii]OAR04387.1 glutamine--fructose-6-phosphate aminotransferase [Hydrogenibacillus schlegelii]PTQ52409.1 MAG: Glucosamine--fructose-6-phosphate aminotransferase [isomerizing] [Hydrogenibacillus schlegelii]
MCGIVGYVGTKQAVPILIRGLRALEYRGYDSAGIAVYDNGVVQVRKRNGRIDHLEAFVGERPLRGTLGIGHTRWATHGQPSNENAHPHADCTGDHVVVHNGIIENYAELRDELKAQGHRFTSETDTEVVAHLIEALYDGDLVNTVRRAAARLEGAYALVAMSRQEPDKIVAVKRASPLIIGLGEGENFLASDIPALLPYTRRVIPLEEEEMAVLTSDGVKLIRLDGTPVTRAPMWVNWDPVQAERGGYEHFMLKEIHEQPQAVRDTLSGRINRSGDGVLLDGVHLDPEWVRGLRSVYLVACGTAYHAGLIGGRLIERLAGIPVWNEVASEFRSRDPLIDERTLFVAISQSGETADTLSALREARRRGARILAVTNVVGSSVAREADDVVYTWAGPEIAVASTKAYTTQVVALALLALRLAEITGHTGEQERRDLLEALRFLSEALEQALELEEDVRAIGERTRTWRDAFFIGRGLDYFSALEGQLKLKEISYIHAEAYPAGELKHGTLALIEPGTPVIALMTQPDQREKMISNIEEVRARGADVLLIARQDLAGVDRHAQTTLMLPAVHPLLMPVVAAVPLQLLAYYAAVTRGADVDKPRNLAKSVTVE